MENEDLSKRYYKIGEVSELLGISISTLRHWERDFSIIRPKRTDGFTRLYTPADIESIRLVRYLVKEKGMHIRAAQAEINRNRDNTLKRVEVITRLRQVRQEIVRMKEALDTIRFDR